MNSKKSVGTGTNIAEVLALVFIVLKLTKLIDWPWIWVLSPIWIMAIIAIICYAILAIVKAIIDSKMKGKRER